MMHIRELKSLSPIPNWAFKILAFITGITLIIFIWDSSIKHIIGICGNAVAPLSKTNSEFQLPEVYQEIVFPNTVYLYILIIFQFTLWVISLIFKKYKLSNITMLALVALLTLSFIQSDTLNRRVLVSHNYGVVTERNY